MSQRVRSTILAVVTSTALVACQTPTDPATSNESGSPAEAQLATTGQSSNHANETNETSLPNDLQVLQGAWLVGDGANVRLHLTVEGNTVSVRTVGAAPDATPRSAEFNPALVAPGHVRFDARLLNADSSIELFFSSQDEAVALLAGEIGAMTVRREQPFPTVLQGQWNMGFAGNYHVAGTRIEVSADRWAALNTGDREVRGGCAYGVSNATTHGTIALCPHSGEAAIVRNYRVIDDNTVIVWNLGSDDMMVWTRGDTRPDWLPEASATLSVEDSDAHHDDERTTP